MDKYIQVAGYNNIPWMLLNFNHKFLKSKLQQNILSKIITFPCYSLVVQYGTFFFDCNLNRTHKLLSFHVFINTYQPFWWIILYLVKEFNLQQMCLILL